MKEIINWRKATVFDLESDGLLNEATIFHVLSFHMADGKSGSIDGEDHVRFKKFLQYHISNKIPVVAHRGILFDIALCEKLLGINLEDLMVVDTLAISWYLNTKRKIHGLDSFLEDYGIKKPKVDGAAWVLPVRGLKTKLQAIGKGADKKKIVVYHYLKDVEDPTEDYLLLGITPKEQSKELLDSMETLDDHNLRLKEHKELMKVRCEEDVKINLALWQDFMKRLHEMYTITKHCIDNDKVNSKRMSEDEVTYLDRYVGSSTVDEYIDRCLTFLMFKMDCARLQEKTRWKADVEYLKNTEDELSCLLAPVIEALEAIMPPIPVYGNRKKPDEPLKKDKTLKVASIKWNDAIKDLGMKDCFGNEKVKSVEGVDNELKILSSYNKPNANSTDQLKALFFSHGWVPETFKYVKDQDAMEAWVKGGFRKEDKPIPRKIPQISKDGDNGKELCPSLVRLGEDVPEILKYNKYTMLKHRLDTIKGFLRNVSEDGYLMASIGGYTNTLRVMHREIVNLVGVDKEYGENIRGGLTCLEDEILLGSDLSSLEDRTKHHFMLPHDPEYVETMMADDYDPHILTAHSAGMITDEELKGFKEGTLTGEVKENVSKARKGGKCTNYACLPVENTEVLTEGGWKYYNEILLEDKVMSLNTITGVGEFTQVERLHFYPNAKVVMLGHSDFKVESTKNHRWFVSQRKEKLGKKVVDKEFKTTEEINTESSIVTSTPYIGGHLDLPKEAGILSWMLSDGYYKKKGRSIRFEISQAKFKYLDEIECLIKSAGYSYTKRLNSGSNSVYILTLSADSARLLMSRLDIDFVNKHEFDYTKFLLNLSNKSLKSFYECFKKADGLTSKKYKGLNYNSDVIYQNGGKVHDAIQLCAELLGYSVKSTKRSNSDKCFNLNIRKLGKVGMQNSKIQEIPNKDVFCLTTANGTFMIRQGGRIMITGNCVYGGSPDAIARSAGIDVGLAKKLHEGYWKLNWSVNAISDEQCVFEDSRKQKWLINPINGFCYSLRTEKDRFSTLAQGSGSFFFDMWVDRILTIMEKTFKSKKLTGSFHK